MISQEYMTPCGCDGCKGGEHCQRCLHGNPGSHFLWVPQDADHPQAGKCVPAWFHTCFPEHRRVDGTVHVPEGAC